MGDNKPDTNASRAGRDRNKNAFCAWMAGGGVNGGAAVGAADELGAAAVENTVRMPDRRAAVRRLSDLRLDQPFAERIGPKEKLTGVREARPVEEILA